MGEEVEQLVDQVEPDMQIDVHAHVPDDLHGFDFIEAGLFLERVASGWGETQAGISKPLNWSLLKVRQFCAIDGIKDILFALREANNESVEQAVLKTALRGNPAAQKLWLINKAGHRGWADRRSVKVEGEVDHNMVVSVKQALDEQTRVLVEADSTQGIAALQRAIGLGDDPEYDVIDVESEEITDGD